MKRPTNLQICKPYSKFYVKLYDIPPLFAFKRFSFIAQVFLLLDLTSTL
jgi:hypothetical protein